MTETKIARPFSEARHDLHIAKDHIEKRIKGRALNTRKDWDENPYTHIVVYIAAVSVESHSSWLHEENIQDVVDYLSENPMISHFVIHAIGEQVHLVNK